MVPKSEPKMTPDSNQKWTQIQCQKRTKTRTKIGTKILASLTPRADPLPKVARGSVPVALYVNRLSCLRIVFKLIFIYCVPNDFRWPSWFGFTVELLSHCWGRQIFGPKFCWKNYILNACQIAQHHWQRRRQQCGPRPSLCPPSRLIRFLFSSLECRPIGKGFLIRIPMFWGLLISIKTQTGQ